MLMQIAQHKHDYFELYPYFKKDITLKIRLKAFKLKDIIPYSMKQTMVYKRIKSILKK